VEPALPDTAHARIRITQDGLNHFAGAMTLPTAGKIIMLGINALVLGWRWLTWR